jgi:hypothetical protein
MGTLVSAQARPSLRELGRIGLGVKVKYKKRGKDEHGWRPKNTPDFYLRFYDAEDQAMKLFTAAYPGEWVESEGGQRYRVGNNLPVVLPFNNLEDNFDDWYTCFRSKVLVAKVGLNSKLGEGYFFQMKIEDGHMIVRQWKDKRGAAVPVDMAENADDEHPFGQGPVIYTTQGGEPVYLLYSMQLKVLVPELIQAVGFLSVYSSSPRNGGNIMAALLTIQEMAERFNQGKMAGIPMFLQKRVEASRQAGTNKVNQQAFIHLYVHGAVNRAHFLATQALSVGGGVQDDGLLTAGADPVEVPYPVVDVIDVVDKAAVDAGLDEDVEGWPVALLEQLVVESLVPDYAEAVARLKKSKLITVETDAAFIVKWMRYVQAKLDQGKVPDASMAEADRLLARLIREGDDE